MTPPDAKPLLPLLCRFQPGTALARTDRAISPDLFIVLAGKLAAALPAAENVINVCEDRYHFLLAFAAALIAGKLTLTPASRAMEAVERIRRDVGDSHIVNDALLAAQLQRIAAATSQTVVEPLPIPAIAADQAAITLFTSGSSGQPTAHCKTWGMLVQGAEQLQRAFNVQPGSCIVGTVPPQHMFGLESTIVFPLQWGCTIHHARPLLPADIEQTVNNACAPVWLMTTPVHLRACANENLTLSGIAGAVCATMPLDLAGAQAAERILHCPLHEIYGCTEAGMIATRRPALNSEWQLCSDFRLQIDDAGQGRLEGMRTVQALMLADRIVMHTAERFSLYGRSGDMIKIAGKRTTLATLNAELLAIDGVSDGSFFQPGAEGGGEHDDRRLSACVVAPRLSTRDIAAALRRRIDSVFIPRPLWKVASLPRDGNGKLSRAALEKLAAMSTGKAEDVSTNYGTGTVTAEHAALDGHFPGNPIVPGVLLLSEVMQLAARSHRVAGIKQAKFHAPLRPGQPYAISLEPASSGTIRFVIRHGQSPIASGLLQYEAQS